MNGTVLNVVLGGRIAGTGDRLNPGRKMDIGFDGPAQPFKVGTLVNIQISYSADSLPNGTNQAFQFSVSKDSDGKYVWIDAGNGMTPNEVADVNRTVTTPFDVAPFLDVRVNSVENNSQSDTNHPLKISYSWQNWGHVPATGVYIEWGVMRLRDSFIIVWSNRWPVAFLNEVLKPNATKATSTVYSDKTSPAVFDGILSGNLVLIGNVHFKDLQNNDYQMAVKAIRTNNEFQVRYINLGGHFQEIEKDFKIKIISN
jgi:hypothetical protein